jgi:hypothetical protein
MIEQPSPYPEDILVKLTKYNKEMCISHTETEFVSLKDPFRDS